jgi:hypothetical protein
MNDVLKRAVRRKVAAMPVVEPVAVAAVAVEEPVDLFMTAEEIAQLELYKARIEMNGAVRDKFAVQEQLLGIEYQRQRDVFRGKHGEAVMAIERIRQEYNAYRARVQDRLGVNLDEYAVQDSGRLVLTPNPA